MARPLWEDTTILPSQTTRAVPGDGHRGIILRLHINPSTDRLPVRPVLPKDWKTGWTIELTVFTTLDLLADAAGFASLMDIFASQRREQAALAADATGAIGARRQRATTGPKPVERKSSLFSRMRDSMLVTWSLNTIIPASHKHHGIGKAVLLELTSMIPLELLSISLQPNSLHLLRILKMLRLYRVPGCFRELKKMYTGSTIVQMLEYTGNAVLFNTVVLGWLGVTGSRAGTWQSHISSAASTFASA